MYGRCYTSTKRVMGLLEGDRDINMKRGRMLMQLHGNSLPKMMSDLAIIIIIIISYQM